MSTNVYQAPHANLVIETDINDQQFYIVSPKKFWVLFISTLGLYGIYWFYKNWALYRDATESNIWPVPRAIFSIFFTHSLFRNINKELEEKEPDANWGHAGLATFYVVITLFERVADKFVAQSLGDTASTLLTLITIPVTAWIFYQAQLKINIVCDAVGGEDNANFTPANIVWIVLGALLWLVFFASIAVMQSPELMGL